MEPSLKLLPRLAPRPLPKKEDCLFYHTFDLPDGETVAGHWDIRGLFHQYIGNYPLKGKRVLDVGTASGFLSFNAEIEGAVVTSLEGGSVSEMDRIPFVNGSYHVDREKWVSENASWFEELKNGFWYLRHKLKSNVSVTYTPIRELHNYDEQFDIVIAGAIIEHLADPVSFIGAICRMAKEAVIVAFTPVEISPAQYMQTMNQWSDPKVDFTWWLLSEGLYRRVFANLGFEIELIPAKAVHTFGEHREEQRYTIVARRVAPLGGKPVALDQQIQKKAIQDLKQRLFKLR